MIVPEKITSAPEDFTATLQDFSKQANNEIDSKLNQDPPYKEESNI